VRIIQSCEVTKQTRKKASRRNGRPLSDLQPGDYDSDYTISAAATWQAEDDGASVAWLLGLLVGDGTFVRNESKSNVGHPALLG
jgi:hypothetical protein